MAVKELHVRGYRSVREIRLKLKRINVLVGPNGCGKSNLYRSMTLIAAAASGEFAKSLAQEGGIPSVLWAGKRTKSESAHLVLDVKLDELSYSLECGRIPKGERPELFELECFQNDPDIKKEEVNFSHLGKKVTLVKRSKGLIMARNIDGRPIEYPLAVNGTESVLSGLRDPQKFPELSTLRQEFLNWRFYHQFRTDLGSPLRQPQVGVMTPVMAHDGLDVAAALATVKGIGQGDHFSEALQNAFPGSALEVFSDNGEFSLGLQMAGFERPFNALELSDGTLQYLCLLAALLTPRPPSFMALNEPETSIHPDLYEPLAKLIVQASKKSQIWITTHSRELSNFIRKHGGNEPIELEKIKGETRVVGAKLIENDEDDFDDD